jgi:hypothetical protein
MVTGLGAFRAGECLGLAGRASADAGDGIDDRAEKERADGVGDVHVCEVEDELGPAGFVGLERVGAQREAFTLLGGEIEQTLGALGVGEDGVDVFSEGVAKQSVD